MKDASMRRTVGPGGSIRVRSDSSWMVPEPELGLVLGTSGEPVAVTIGNDVSSRDIEGANPLYIPQAKIFAGACAIGPVIAVPEDWAVPFEIFMRIKDAAGVELFAGWATRDNPIPPGSVLLTGTGLVPPDDYTLLPGHTVEIEIGGIGVLANTVAA
jgi:2-dehydro-3-deoxy-D-arabinonate dehydratase